MCPHSPISSARSLACFRWRLQQVLIPFFKDDLDVIRIHDAGQHFTNLLFPGVADILELVCRCYYENILS